MIKEINKDKPSKEVIEEYCLKIEKLLSAHKISLNIKILETPTIIKSYRNDKLTNIEYYWVENFLVKHPDLGEFKILLPHFFIQDFLNDDFVFDDANYIQEEIYKKKGISPNISDRDDPYWEIWKYWEKNKLKNN